MASAAIKIAYIIFLSSFVTWLALLCSIGFSNGTWATPIRFPNIFMLTVFMVSAVAASISSGIIGMSYLGISFNFKHRQSLQSQRSDSPILQESPVLIANMPGDSAVAEVEEPDLNICVLMLTEEEEATHKT